MATVRVDIIKGLDGKFHAQTRINPSINDRVRIGDYLCSVETEIEGGLRQSPEMFFEIHEKIAIFLGLLMSEGEHTARMAVPDLKITVP